MRQPSSLNFPSPIELLCQRKTQWWETVESKLIAELGSEENLKAAILQGRMTKVQIQEESDIYGINEQIYFDGYLFADFKVIYP